MRITKFVLALWLTFLTGCSASRALLVHPGTDPEELMLGSDPRRVSGYVLEDGRRVAFEGTVEARGDTLRFVRPRLESRGLELTRPRVIRDVPRDSVVIVNGEYTDVGRSIFLGLGLTAAILLILGLAWASSFTIFGP